MLAGSRKRIIARAQAEGDGLMRDASENFVRHLILASMLSGWFLLFGCASSESSRKDEDSGAAATCTEPENPYSEGTGHYAGYEWAEKHGSGTCNTSSSSFNEGCEEYESQEAVYQACEARKKH
jgi:hypothetical protein